MSNNLVSDAEVEKALDFLRDNAKAFAAAKAERIYCEEFRKSLKAILMQQVNDLPLGAQEREAYAHGEYAAHLGKLRDAVQREEELRALGKAAELKIEAWRTMNANYRSMKI